MNSLEAFKNSIISGFTVHVHCIQFGKYPKYKVENKSHAKWNQSEMITSNVLIHLLFRLFLCKCVDGFNVNGITHSH